MIYVRQELWYFYYIVRTGPLVWGWPQKIWCCLTWWRRKLVRQGVALEVKPCGILRKIPQVRWEPGDGYRSWVMLPDWPVCSIVHIPPASPASLSERQQTRPAGTEHNTAAYPAFHGALDQTEPPIVCTEDTVRNSGCRDYKQAVTPELTPPVKALQTSRCTCSLRTG